MRDMTWLRYTAIAMISALGFIACGSEVVGGGGGNTSTGSTTTGSTTTTATTTTSVSGPYDACAAAADCAWGEIDHELLAATDCTCLYGCPYIPRSKATVDLRQSQYTALCTPGKDGQGNPCGIDDCATPPVIACQGGHCVAATPTP